MSSQQKRGFRLPWAERAPEGGTGAATLDRAADEAGDGVNDEVGELGEGPDGPADSAEMTTNVAPAAFDPPAAPAEAAMIDTESPTREPAADVPADAKSGTRSDAKSAGTPQAGGAWPDSDTARATAQNSSTGSEGSAAPAAPRPSIRPHAPGTIPRRDNPLVAGLVKAMREAAVASREETASRLQAEAKARTDTIRTRATSEVAELRKRADDDVAGIREWSKAEIARVRQATEGRIDARKAELEGETQRHAASVDRLVDDVQAVVTSFEAEMDDFFEQLLKETDPARLATLAEQAPEPPDLSGDGPAAIDLVFDGDGANGTAGDTADGNGVLLAADAAEAEAEATEGLDLSGNTAWPAAALAGARRGDTAEPVAGDAPDGAAQTRLLVTGLASVAGISAFKGALGQLPRVHGVSVSTGERGVFVFAVDHEPEADLASGITGIAGFGARITDAAADGVSVVAHEPAA